MGKKQNLALGIAYQKVPTGQEDDEGNPIFLLFRGLSPAEIRSLAADASGQALSRLYDELTRPETRPDDIMEIAASILRESPELLAKIIARAADNPEDWAEVITWTMGFQLECAVVIGQATFKSDGLVKKLIGELMAKVLMFAESRVERKTKLPQQDPKT